MSQEKIIFQTKFPRTKKWFTRLSFRKLDNDTLEIIQSLRKALEEEVFSKYEELE